MKPLETNQLVLTWFGLSPADKAPTKWQKILYKASTFLLILSILSIFISSLAFFYRFVLIDLEKALYAVYQFVGLFSALYLCMVAYLSRPQINSTLNQLSNIYHESKSFDSNSKTFNSNYVTQRDSRFRWNEWKMFLLLQMQTKIRLDFWPRQITKANGCMEFFSKPWFSQPFG